MNFILKCIKNKLLFCLIILLTLIVFSSSLQNGFTTWDDPQNVYENLYIREFSISNITAWFSKPLLAMYTPLIYLSYAIDYKLGGLNPFVYHLHNLLLHLINITLVFLMLKLLTKRDEVAIIVALFFAIHPLNVAAVAPVSTRGTLLYSMFFLSSLISYIYYLQRGKDKRYYYAALFLFLLSALSKSQSVVLPLVLLIIDYYDERVKKNNGLDIKMVFGIICEKIPFFVISLLFGILTIVFREDAGHIWSPYSFSLLDRPFLIFYSFVFYIWKLFFPFNLSAYYTYPDNTSGYLPLEYYLSPLLILFIVFLILKIKGMRKELIFGFLFYITNIVLVLKIIPMGHENVCDRYAYMPNIGWFFIIVQTFCYIRDKKIKFISERLNPKTLSHMLVVIFVIYGCVFSFISFNRNIVWKDTFTLFGDVLSKNPNLAFAYNHIGAAKHANRDYKGAISEYNKAIELSATYLTAYYNRAKAKEKLGDFDGAIDDYTYIVNVYPDAVVYKNLGFVKSLKKDYQGAISEYSKAIILKPDYAVAYNDRGLVKALINDFDGALQDYTKAIELDRKLFYAYINRGVLFATLGNHKKSILDFDKAIEINSKDAEAYLNRGNAKATIGDIYSAFQDVNKALEINPNHSGAYLNRGIAKLSLKDGTACLDWQKAAEFGEKQAIELLRQYCNR